MQKQVNKSDWDGSDIIFKRKICIYSARGPSLANVTEKKLLFFFYFFFFEFMFQLNSFLVWFWYERKKRVEHG